MYRINEKGKGNLFGCMNRECTRINAYKRLYTSFPRSAWERGGSHFGHFGAGFVQVKQYQCVTADNAGQNAPCGGLPALWEGLHAPRENLLALCEGFPAPRKDQDALRQELITARLYKPVARPSQIAARPS